MQGQIASGAHLSSCPRHQVGVPSLPTLTLMLKNTDRLMTPTVYHSGMYAIERQIYIQDSLHP